MKRIIAMFTVLFAVLLFQVSPSFAGPMPGAADAKKVVVYAKANRWQPQAGYQGNTKFQNREKKLPLRDDAIAPADKAKLTFKEYDVDPLVKGKNRGAERVIIALKSGAFYKAYYTKDHYTSFTEIK